MLQNLSIKLSVLMHIIKHLRSNIVFFLEIDRLMYEKLQKLCLLGYTVRLFRKASPTIQ